MVWDYYQKGLAAERLQRVYEIAPPRVRQYLDAEIAFVRSYVKPGMDVLELGCGYGRAIFPLANDARSVIGIDNSAASVQWGREHAGLPENCELLVMDALHTGFADASFDLVFCIQNGISAFHADRAQLMKEAIRLTKANGTVLFSSYSEKFWEARLEWFRMQAAAGLLGEIDEEKTGNGEIVCRDGFTATTLSAEQLRELATRVCVECEVVEVDESSLFCVLKP